MMAAHFQLPKTLSQQEKDEYVASIIDSLGLNKCQDTIIGDHKTRGVSGGERKPCNIGVELIKNPSVLFLDEPTSCLDSFQAQSVMACMQTMAASGRTVVASIHQPRSSIYSMFDQLLLLAELLAERIGAGLHGAGADGFCGARWRCTWGRCLQLWHN